MADPDLAYSPARSDSIASFRGLLSIWLRVGLKSFGGGQVTQFYAYEALVEARGWLTPQEWSEARGLCQLAPGMNLIALALLTGWRLAGPPGAVSSTLGLLLPSVTITILIASAYSRVEHLALVTAALHGLLPAAAAATLVMSWRLARPIFITSAAKGSPALAAFWLILAGTTLLVAAGRLPVYAVLVGAGFVMSSISVVYSRVRHDGAS